MRAVLPDADVATVLVRPCPDPKFGDYQTNALMSLAKAREAEPAPTGRRRGRQARRRRLLREGRDCRRRLPEFPAQARGAGRRPCRPPRAANTSSSSQPRSRAPWSLISARPMWPSRCTSATSARPSWAIRLARTLRLLGHRVITDNHLGDWGTQFGMLLVGWKRHLDRRRARRPIPSPRWNASTRQVSAAVRSQIPPPSKQARQELVKLQARRRGEPRASGAR